MAPSSISGVAVLVNERPRALQTRPNFSSATLGAAMRAYKFLDAQGCTVMSGRPWPLPTGDAPGPWLEAEAVRPCREGIHACRAGDLAYWIHDELWEIELDGEIEESHRKVVARRGRLTRRLRSWSAGASKELAAWCAWRSRDLAVTVLRDSGASSWAERLAGADALREVARLAREAVPVLGDAAVDGIAAGLAGDAAALAPTRHLAMGPFVAACAAAHAATRHGGTEEHYASAFAAERQAQSEWIAHRLSLA
jgi:hypothetical protein